MAKDKYENRKPDSPAQTFFAALRFGLMLLGIIGIAVELIRDEGMVRKLLGNIFDSQENFIAALVVAFLLYLAWRWISNAPAGSKRGDIPMYAMMAIGGFFVFRLATTGGF